MWTQQISSGGASARDALATGWIAGCPTAPQVLASAIRAASTSSDTVLLSGLVFQTSDARDEAIFRGLLEVAADRRATPAARTMAILAGAAQLGYGTDVPGRSLADLFTTTPAPTPPCLGHRYHAPVLQNPLAGDPPRRYAAVLDGILAGSGSDHVRAVASCVRGMIGVPTQVDISRLRVDYVCGNRFRVQNHTGTNLELDYVVEGGDPEGWIIHAPAVGRWTEFDVDEAGTLHVSYDGRAIASIRNQGKRCPGEA